MASIVLNRPAANTTITVNPAEHYILNFAGKDVMLTKEDDTLAFGFDDGGKIVIENYYAENSNSRDSRFEMNGMEFDAEKFFTAMDEPDLIPAAGPEQQQPKPTDSNSYHEYDTMASVGGLEYLDGLDYASDGRAFEATSLRTDDFILPEGGNSSIGISIDTAIHLRQEADGVHISFSFSHAPTGPATFIYDINGETFIGQLDPGQTSYEHPIVLEVPRNPFGDAIHVTADITDADGFPGPVNPSLAEDDFANAPTQVTMTLEVSENGGTGTVILSEAPRESGTITLTMPDGSKVDVSVEPGKTVYEDIPLPPQDKDNPYGDEKGEVTAELEGGGYVLPVPPADDDFSYPPTDVEMKLEVERTPEGTVGTITVSEPPKEDCPVNITLPDGSTITAVIPAGESEVKVDLPPNDKDNPYGDINPDDYRAEIPEGNGDYAKPVPPADDDLDFPPTKVELNLEISGPADDPTAKITLSEPPSDKGEISLTMPDGTEITVPVVPGQTEYETPLPPRQGDDPYRDSDDNIVIKAELDGGGYALPVDPDMDDMPLLGIHAETEVTLTETPDGVQVSITLEYPPKEPADIEYTINGEEFSAHVEPGQTVIHHPDLIPVPDSPYKTDPVDVKVEVTGFTGGGFADPRPGAEAEGSYEGDPVPVKMTLDVSDDGATGTITLEYPPIEDGEITVKLPDGREITVDLVKGQDTYPNVKLPEPAGGSPYESGKVDVTAEIEGGGYALPVQPATDDYIVPPVTPTLTLTVEDVPGDVEIGTITLDYKPVESGTITVTPVGGGEPIIIDLVPGQTEYKVDLPHDPASNPYSAGEDVKWQAELTGGGFAADKLCSNEDGIHMDGVGTEIRTELSQDADGNVIITFNIADEPQKETVTFTYTVNGEEFTGEIPVGGNSYAHPDAVSVPGSPYESGQVEVRVEVSDPAGGDFPKIDATGNEGVYNAPFEPTTLTLVVTDVEGDIEHGVLTLDNAPVADGTITITGPEGDEITVDLVIGQTEYTVDLPHKPVDTVTGGKNLTWEAGVSGGGYADDPKTGQPQEIKADDSLEFGGEDTRSVIMLSESEHEVTVSIIVTNAPVEDVEITYVINGEEFTGTLKAGERIFTHPETIPVEKGFYEGDNTPVDVHVVSMTDGGLANIVPPKDMSNVYKYFGTPKLTFTATDVDGDIESGVLTLDVAPKTDGTITVTPKDGGEPIVINLIPGEKNYTVDLPHKAVTNPYEAGESFTWDAHVDGGGYHNQPNDAGAALDLPGVSTSATITMPDPSEVTPGEPVTVTIRLDNPPKDEPAVVKYTVNGEEYEKTLQPGETEFEHVIDLRDPDGDGTPDEPGDDGKVHVEVKVTDITGGKFADTQPPAPADQDYGFAGPSIDFGDGHDVRLSEAALPDGSKPDVDKVSKDDSFTINMNGVAGTLTIGGTDIEVDGNGNADVSDLSPIRSGGVEITINSIVAGKVDYTVKLAGNEGHLGEESETSLHNIMISLSNKVGDAKPVSFMVTVADDVPEISLTETAIDAVSGQDAETGGVLAWDYGADRGDGAALRVNGEKVVFADGKAVVTGQYGVLTIDQATGKYSYKANANVEGEDRFAFSVIDSDGDIVSTMKIGEGDDAADVPTTIVVNVKPADEPGEQSNIQADESALGNAIDISVPGFTIVGVKGQPAHGRVEESNGKWTYTLTEAIDSGSEQGANVVADGDKFTVTVKDSAGNTFDVELGVDIKDAVPTINVSATVIDAVSGNDAAITGTMSFDYGADGAGSFKVNGKEVAFVDGKAEITGNYGVLTIDQASGEYSYKANANAEGEDRFAFSVTDFDGDIVSAMKVGEGDDAADVPTTIVVNVKPADEPETPSNIQADEAAQDNGIDISVPGFTIVDVKTDPEHGSVAKDEQGNWKYTLTEAIDSGNEQGANVVTDGDKFTVTVKDSAGNTFDVELGVDIKDAVPTINLSATAIEAVSGNDAATTGTLTFDYGADGAGSLKVNGKEVAFVDGKCEIKGDYGVLTIDQASGEYSYKANANTNGEDRFEFSLTDSDGDIVSTMEIGEGDDAADVPTIIVVNVKPADSPETPSNIQADEAALNNAIDISVPGFTIISVKGQPDHGTVKETNGKWTYTLNEAIASGDIQGANLVKDGDSFTVIVKDSAGNIFDVELGVDIRDDVPTATVKAGTTDIASGQETIVALTHDFGADGAGSITINGKEYVPGDRDFKVDGDFGTLHVNDAGELVYTANANATGADTFRFTVTDSDGDIAQSDADGNPDGGIPEITFNVAKPDGPAALHNISVTEGGTVDAAVVLPDGYTLVELKSAPSYGEYKDGVYTLTKTFAHTEQGADTAENADSIVLVVKDANGNTYEIVQNIDIVDDAPVSEDLSENINEGAAEPITGNVGGNAGADGLDRVDWTGAENGAIRGKYGTLTVNENGSWSYELDNANPAVMGLATGEKLEDETFNFKVYDKDGDHADSTLAIAINGESHGITITPETPDPEVPADPDKPVDKDDATTQGASVSVNEANLPGAANPDDGALTKTGKIAIEAADGIKSITLGGTEIDLNGGLTDIPVENGILKVSYIDGELSYTFTLDKNAPHTEQGGDTLSQNLKLEVENLEGGKKESTLRINITDDIPTAEDVSREIGKGADEALTGSVSGSVTPGADGFKDSGNPVQWGTEAAKYGEFVHHEDGSWEYRVNNASEAVMGLKTGETLIETFTYKVMDADGDVAEAELTVTIKGKTNDVKITPSNPADPDPETDNANTATAQVFEKNLENGTSTDAAALKQTGSFAVESADGVKSISFGGQDIPLEGKEITIKTADGLLTVSYAKSSDTNGVLNYTYELTKANGSHSAQGADFLAHDFALSVTSFAGKTETASLNVNVVDDVPEHKGSGEMLPTLIWIHATDNEGDHFAKSMWVIEGLNQIDKTINSELVDPRAGLGSVDIRVYRRKLNQHRVI